MKVEDILIKIPFNIERSGSLSLIITAIRETNLDTVPVVDKDRRLVGIINLYDIAKIFEPYSGPMAALVKTLPFLDDVIEKDLSINSINPELARLCIAEDIMNTDFITLTADMDLEKAYSIMMTHKVSLVCAVNEGQFLGMVRLLDIVVNLLSQKGIS